MKMRCFGLRHPKQSQALITIAEPIARLSWSLNIQGGSYHAEEGSVDEYSQTGFGLIYCLHRLLAEPADDYFIFVRQFWRTYWRHDLQARQASFHPNE
jgi:hypothetical protein